MDTVLFLTVLVLQVVAGVSLPCEGLVPPQDGVLKCQYQDDSLLCTATCYPGLEFGRGKRFVSRFCEKNTGLWFELNDGVWVPAEQASLPSCFVPCRQKLLSTRTLQPPTGLVLTASSAPVSDVNKGPNAALLVNDGAWRAATDDVVQFIQVDLGAVHRLTGVVIRGDTRGGYVKLFRLLFSNDGFQWYPYSDGNREDKFFTGNFDSVTELTMTFDRPQTARYVRLNPLSWEQHVTLQFDLLGCPTVTKPQPVLTSCRIPDPPENGAVNCERNQTHVLCTAFCWEDLVFQDQGPAIDVLCDDRHTEPNVLSLPACVEKQPTDESGVNVTGLCMRREGDCYLTANGDYQFCGDCHYFSTCSEGYLYVRPCPEQLQYDSGTGRCDYQSTTCNSKSRIVFKETRARHDKPM